MTPSAYTSTRVRRKPVPREARVPMAMTPLERARLTPAGPAAPASAPGAAGARIMPSSGTVCPASDAGVLIRLLRCVVVLGRPPHDVICFAGPAGRIRAVRAAGRAAVPATVSRRPAPWSAAAPEGPADRREDEHADRDPDDHQSEGAEMRRVHGERRRSRQRGPTGGEQAEPERARTCRRGLDANRDGPLLVRGDGHPRDVGQDGDLPVTGGLYIEKDGGGLVRLISYRSRPRAFLAAESDLGRVDDLHELLAGGEIPRNPLE